MRCYNHYMEAFITPAQMIVAPPWTRGLNVAFEKVALAGDLFIFASSKSVCL